MNILHFSVFVLLAVFSTAAAKAECKNLFSCFPDTHCHFFTDEYEFETRLAPGESSFLPPKGFIFVDIKSGKFLRSKTEHGLLTPPYSLLQPENDLKPGAVFKNTLHLDIPIEKIKNVGIRWFNNDSYLNPTIAKYQEPIRVDRIIITPKYDPNLKPMSFCSDQEPIKLGSSGKGYGKLTEC